MATLPRLQQVPPTHETHKVVLVYPLRAHNGLNRPQQFQQRLIHSLRFTHRLIQTAPMAQAPMVAIPVSSDFRQ